MHYKNGRPAKVGDKVLYPNGAYSIVGVVVEANADCDTCNLTIQPLVDVRCATASECVHLDDAANPAPPSN